MRADDILAQIDNALEDWEVGPDAMRSRPAVEPKTALGPQVWIAPVGTGPDDPEWEAVGHITSIDFHIDPQEIDPGFRQAWEEMRERLARVEAERVRRAQAVLEAFARAYMQAVKPAVEAAGRAIAEAAQAIQQAGLVNADGRPARRRDRPAWQSPYGPPRRGRRR
ncbi:hypothetical protein ACIF8T_21755 [Streptomyces sp. NPDC085946]|uniref:hypothetical protein n=1 Tax=Streptomyces sp. NPDC085946 TaxID=3365744 RepID=UPI0037D5E569